MPDNQVVINSNAMLWFFYEEVEKSTEDRGPGVFAARIWILSLYLQL